MGSGKVLGKAVVYGSQCACCGLDNVGGRNSVVLENQIPWHSLSLSLSLSLCV